MIFRYMNHNGFPFFDDWWQTHASAGLSYLKVIDLWNTSYGDCAKQVVFYVKAVNKIAQRLDSFSVCLFITYYSPYIARHNNCNYNSSLWNSNLGSSSMKCKIYGRDSHLFHLYCRGCNLVL